MFIGQDIRLVFASPRKKNQCEVLLEVFCRQETEIRIGSRLSLHLEVLPVLPMLTRDFGC